MAEAHVIAAMLLQRFTLERAEPTPLAAQPGITLRMRSGLPMRLRLVCFRPFGDAVAVQFR